MIAQLALETLTMAFFRRRMNGNMWHNYQKLTAGWCLIKANVAGKMGRSHKRGERLRLVLLVPVS